MMTISKTKLLILFLFVILVIFLTTLNAPINKEKKIFSNSITSDELVQNDKNETPKKLLGYIEVTDSCGPYFESACLNVRSEPKVDSKVVTKLRNGMILRVEKEVTLNGEKWYKISFKDEWLRYDDRLGKDWYISAKYVTFFFDKGIEEVPVNTATTSNTKVIIVDLSDQKLYAYENKKIFMEQSVSTGIEIYRTPRGVFHIYKKTPSRYMQGPIEGVNDDYYDLPGVPWNLYFTEQGTVIHGAYWHNEFGKKRSSGCVNVPPEKAKELYNWAELGTLVIVRD